MSRPILVTRVLCYSSPIAREGRGRENPVNEADKGLLLLVEIKLHVTPSSRGTLLWKRKMFRGSDLDSYRNVYHGFRIRVIKQPIRRVANNNSYFSLSSKFPCVLRPVLVTSVLCYSSARTREGRGKENPGNEAI